MLNSAHSKPSVTPVGGDVRPATAHARHATDLIQQTVMFVLVETLLYMASALCSTAHWDSTLMVTGTIMMRCNVFSC